MSEQDDYQRVSRLEELDKANERQISKRKGENNKISESVENNMDKEDENYLKTISNYTPDEIRKGKNVINQKNLFEFFISMRISFQKILISINSLPPTEAFKNYVDETNSFILKSTLLELVSLLNNFLLFFKELIIKNNYLEKTNELKFANFTEKFDAQIALNSKFQKELFEMKNINLDFLETIITSMKSFSENIFSITEKIINIWYKKALFYSYKPNQKNKILKILNNNFVEHIKKNSESTQLKSRKQSKIKNKTIDNFYNENVYKDDDFYNFLLKEFIVNKDLTNAQETSSGNRIDLTLQYLLNRNKNKKDKNVDTRASKNRKLKFEKHEKLINFMVPLLNHSIDVGRNEIINSIFGKERRRDLDINNMDSDIEII